MGKGAKWGRWGPHEYDDAGETRDPHLKPAGNNHTMVHHTKTAEMILKSINWLGSLDLPDCQRDDTYCCCERCVAQGELYRAWRAELGPVEFPASKKT